MVALTSTLIKDADFEQIKEVLRFIMIKVGLRAQNFPNDLEKLILIQHIQENFGGNTLEEIRLAFDMAIGQKLEIESANCYENFSCVYFSMIMNAYRKWSTEAFRTLPTEVPKEQKIFSQDELDDGYREDAERLYQMFLKGFSLKNPEVSRYILVKDGFFAEGSVVGFFSKRMDDGAKNIYVKK